MPNTGTGWLYVLECQGGVLYTGIAKDVDARFAAHLDGTGAIFTRLNRPLRILAKATMPTKGDALRAERTGKLKAEPRNDVEVGRLLAMARTRLADARLTSASREGRFTSAYNAAHAASVAALRWHG